MNRSDEESINSFTPDSGHQENNEELRNRDNKKYAIINQSVRVQLLRRILSKQSTIKEAAQEFGINFSTAKAILQTYRKEGRVGKKKTRDRNKSKQDLGDHNQSRKIQSMYNLEQPQQIKTISPEVKPSPQTYQQIMIPVMSTPNLDNTQIALAYCQRELAQQKMVNFQLMMMIQNYKNITQVQVKEESNKIN
ncbi:unnamed protein product (macronuclear) [Paramecium tetraurelia]|uniref:Insertion element IS150 protein InsJ-like helix-turn-helix domain-containing protein n=1 Tax=Paramecium tetraurelia TaxID=5888 RepID=A0BKW4_PARTE|nr:uncharacterized protein GSPATT00029812001 [Paramecium tetraurelia]CAK59181.1 unnamed protein product [Paramecium tetraurelia]|eukprot:XP_001426579.1 hypothetical protein (macronuclear) [Paramecium tetraurelia strain d4-2]